MHSAVTPDRMASIHGQAMTTSRAWSQDEFDKLLSDPLVFAVAEVSGFALGRVVLDEAELLTVAVEPEVRRQGVGARLLAAFDGEARARGAVRAFLEVAADNGPARALYARAGWRKTGRRNGYYRRPGAASADALLLNKGLA